MDSKISNSFEYSNVKYEQVVVNNSIIEVVLSNGVRWYNYVDLMRAIGYKEIVIIMKRLDEIEEHKKYIDEFPFVSIDGVNEILSKTKHSGRINVKKYFDSI